MDTEKLKKKILDLAIRGKLVPQDPNGETAQELIKKIQEEKTKLIKEGKIKPIKDESYIFKSSDNSYYEKIGDTIKCIDNEIPFTIPSGWTWVRMPSIGIVKGGLTYKPSEIIENGTPVLRSTNIVNGKIILNDLVRVNSKIRDSQYIETNDILICARNGSKALVGKCAVFDIETSEKYSFGAFMLAYKSPFFKYVYYYLNSYLFRNLLNKDDTKQINQVTLSTLYQTLIPFPPIKEQEQITTLLDRLMSSISTIEVNKNKIASIVSSAKKKILDNIFGENSSYKSYYKTINIQEVCSLENGTKSNKGKYPYLEAKVIRGTKNPNIVEQGIFINKGTRIILVDGENSGEIMIAPFDGYMGSTFKILFINTNLINEEFLSLFILYKKQELKESKTGSAIPHLNKKKFKEFELIYPPIEDQTRIVNDIIKKFILLDSICVS